MTWKCKAFSSHPVKLDPRGSSGLSMGPGEDWENVEVVYNQDGDGKLTVWDRAQHTDAAPTVTPKQLRKFAQGLLELAYLAEKNKG